MVKKAKGQVGRGIVWVILALLIVGLAGFGATNFGGSFGRLGSVGDTEITVDEYARALTQQLRNVQEQTGQAMTLNEGLQFGLDQAVLRRLVANAALDHETSHLGLSVGDTEIREQVLDIPAFHGIDGSFDRDAYEFSLENNNLSVAEFEEGIRTEIARTLLQGAVVGGVAAPDGAVAALVDYVAERRSFTWAAVTEADLAEPLPDPTEEDLRAYHAENPEPFTIPETKRLTYAVLLPMDLMDTIEVDESALQRLYDERIDEFVRPERRLVERLVFPDQQAAEAAKSRLDAGETSFEALTAERGLALDDIDLGDVAERDLGAAGAAVFALAVPGVTGPVDTDLGPALIRMNGILAAQETTFDEAKAGLLEDYASDAARRAVQDRIDGIDDLLAGGATLEDVAAETEMRLGQIDWRPGVEEGLAGYAAFREAAATVTADDFPEVLELEDGGIFALRLDEVVPPTLQPYEDVAEQVAEAWRTDRLQAALVAQADAFVARLSEGATLAGLDLALQTGDALTRDGFVADAPAGLVETVFEMSPGEVRSVAGQTGAAIVRLDTVHAPDPSDPDTATLQQALSQQIAQGMADDMLQAFIRAVEADVGISLDQSAISAVHSQFP